MFLSKRSNGIYYVIYTKKGKRTKISTGTTKKQEASKFLIQFSNNFQEQKENPITQITLKEFCWQFLIKIEATLAWKTVLTYRTTFNEFRGLIGNPNLEDITRANIEEFIQYRIKKTSLHAARKDLINLKAAFTKAVVEGHLEKSPATLIKRIKIPERLPVYFTESEYNILINSISDPDLIDMVEFAVNTGIRQAELINLKWSQVVLKEKVIVLDNQTTLTKSRKVRSVPLNNNAINIIESRNNCGTDSNVFLLNGKPVIQDFLIHKFKKIVRSCKINHKLSWHSLRHTFASRLVQKGVPIYQVSKILGHADIKTTEIYAHLRQDDLINAVNTINYTED